METLANLILTLNLGLFLQMAKKISAKVVVAWIISGFACQTGSGVNITSIAAKIRATESLPTRIKVVARHFLEKNVADQNFARAEYWAAMLGVDSPLTTRMAEAFGLIDSPKPVETVVTMESFGL